MFSALVSPKILSELIYVDLVMAFEERICLKKNVIVTQQKFLSIHQNENQTIPDYIAIF